jgi:hypothetical protein
MSTQQRAPIARGGWKGRAIQWAHRGAVTQSPGSVPVKFLLRSLPAGALPGDEKRYAGEDGTAQLSEFGCASRVPPSKPRC